MDPGGRLLAAGATDGTIRLLDPRTGAWAAQLAGHTDNVRALALSPDGGLLLSGGADHTLRLWDVGQQRCLATMAVHTDSVWALAVDPGFRVAYSGGRDGCVYRTALATRTAELLARERGPVLSLALAQGGSGGSGDSGSRVWVAIPASTVRLWAVAGSVPPAALHTQRVHSTLHTPRGGAAPTGPGDGPTRRTFVAGASPAVRGRLSFSGGGPPLLSPTPGPGLPHSLAMWALPAGALLPHLLPHPPCPLSLASHKPCHPGLGAGCQHPHVARCPTPPAAGPPPPPRSGLPRAPAVAAPVHHPRAAPHPGGCGADGQTARVDPGLRGQRAAVGCHL